MSGGSYDYAYCKLEDLAAAIRERADGSNCRALRLAFAELLQKCAEAAHDIEWVDSGDRSKGDEIASLNAVVSPSLQLTAALEVASKAMNDLQSAIDRAKEASK